MAGGRDEVEAAMYASVVDVTLAVDRVLCSKKLAANTRKVCKYI
jgi:hypothetical protein